MSAILSVVDGRLMPYFGCAVKMDSLTVRVVPVEMEPGAGVEPASCRLQGDYSASELPRLV